jgi:dTMP kinase
VATPTAGIRLPGRFIALEGGEGAGKSRLQAALGDRLTRDGVDVVLTREPGGTPLGEQIRSLVLDRNAIAGALAELLLFEAARAHLVATVIRPGVERGAIVICDRFTGSSVAYQAFGRGLARAVVERANAIAADGVAPDLTLLLDVPVAEGLARRAAGGDKNHFDSETVAFHERVRAGYHDIAGTDASWRVINASRPFEQVFDDALGEILAI